MKISKVPFVYFALLLSTLLLFNCNKQSLLSSEEQEYLANTPDLTVGLYIYNPPYSSVSTHGNVNGILLDYFELLENKINHTFKKKYYSNWQSLIQDAKDAKVDIILEIQKSEERLKYLTFTEPIFKGLNVIITKNDSPLTNINKLAGKKVSVVDDYAVQEYLKKTHPEIILIPHINEYNGIKALRDNEVDAFIGIESTANIIIKNQDYTNLKIQDKLKYDYDFGIGITNQKPLLSSLIIKANQAITSSEKQEISHKWFYDVVKPFHKKASFWKIIFFIIGFTFVLSFVISYYLKREVKKRTNDFMQAKLAAEKSDELKTLFLQNVSHEVRTPLNSIIGFTKFLQQDDLNLEKRDQYINTIIDEGSNLTNILNNIIEISELTTKKTQPKKEIIALGKEFGILAREYESKARTKGLGFHFENAIEQDENYIFSDRLRLTKAIGNILDNALKFTNDGSISFNTEIQNGVLKIRITDSGIGINPLQFEAIFNAFYQEERELSKKYDGLGIGLSIANENIRSLGGEIVPETNETRGTTFIVSLPIKLASHTVENKRTKLQNSVLKILIAEDMKLNYLVLSKTLDKIIGDQKEIVWAKNGQEAIEHFKSSVFDIVLMDIKMPVLNGYEATQAIKKINSQIPIVAQTAYAHEDDYNKAMSIGFDGYITKPIDSNALKRVLQELFLIAADDTLSMSIDINESNI